MEQAESGDFAILVMGVSGEGKSTFIDLLAPGAAKIGNSLNSETKQCDIVQVGLGTQSAYLIDTPGFNDTYRSDGEILQHIVETLCFQHLSGVPLKGVLYLRNINATRMHGTDLAYLRMFREMCGEPGDTVFENVVLLTTRWDEVRDERAAAQAQRQLRGFASDMTDGGMDIRQFDGSALMAQQLVETFGELPNIVLKIQHEVLEEGLTFEETAAGRSLRDDVLKTQLAGEDTEVRGLERDVDRAVQSRDEVREQEARVKLTKARDRQQRLKDDQALMKKAVGADLKVQFEKKGKSERWKNAIQIVASLLGVGITIAVNVILPLAGVALGG